MKQYEVFTLTMTGPILTENYAQVDLTAQFTNGGRTVTVRGFYDGAGQYMVRFLPPTPGVWSWQVTGVCQAAGSEECTPAAPGMHGLVQAKETHFCFEDGSAYLPFGTTVYALAHQEDALVEQTLQTLAAAPFNKVRMCLFPKSYEFNHNEPPCYAFRKKENGWDVSSPDLDFWHRLETILARLGALGIQVDLILFHPYDRWGFSRLSMAENEQYLDYLLRRLAAFPHMWWSMANEYDLMFGRTMEDWQRIEAQIAAQDPYHHLLSNHNCFAVYDFSRPAITHCCVQTSLTARVPEYRSRYQKPVIFDEMSYEGDIEASWGNISAQEMVHRFWSVCVLGGYGTHGETFYSDDDILWWSRGGILKGQSPARIGWLKELLYSLPGPLEPVLNSWQAIGELEPGELREKMASMPEVLRGFVGAYSRLSGEESRMMRFRESMAFGRVGKACYLNYYGHSCPRKVTLTLPVDGAYRVEVLDTWAMTRTVALDRVQAAEAPDMFGVSEPGMGPVAVALPGREGMAVLATRL